MLKTILSIITVLPHLMAGVQQMFESGDGAKKEKAVIGMTNDLFNVAELVKGREIVDQGMWADGLKDVIKGTKKMLKASAWNSHS